jgi:hypothetical protein
MPDGSVPAAIVTPDCAKQLEAANSAAAASERGKSMVVRHDPGRA